MTELYPIKFIPIIKEKIWGGEKLHQLLGKDLKGKINGGESWELCGMPDDVSIVSNGFLEGNSLEEIIEIYMGDLVGDKVFEKFGLQFPLLFKFIDAADDLSIQVHPNDVLAKERHRSFGKTEMWYVLQADSGASLISGFSGSIDQQRYLNLLGDGRLNEVMKKNVASAGEVFVIEAGTVHAIGKGILLAEIQQVSDITYRIFDYGRKDHAGNQRELHNDLAIEAINFNPGRGAVPYAAVDGKSVQIIDCPFFTVNVLEISKPLEKDYYVLDSFVVFMCVDGKVNVVYSEGQKETLKKGETMLIPAELKKIEIIPERQSRLLEVYIS